MARTPSRRRPANRPLSHPFRWMAAMAALSATPLLPAWADTPAPSSLSSTAATGAAATPATPDASTDSTTQSTSEKLAHVTTLTTRTAPWTHRFEAYGMVEAADPIQVAAGVGGTVEVVLVSPGQPVTAGDVLARLDDGDSERALQTTILALQDAQTTLKEQEDLLARAEALAGRATTAAALDAQRAATDRARTAAARATLDLEQARERQAQHLLTAPADGVVIDSLLTPGQEIAAGTDAFLLAGGARAAWTGALSPAQLALLDGTHSVALLWGGQHWDATLDRVEPTTDANGLPQVRLIVGTTPPSEDASLPASSLALSTPPMGTTALARFAVEGTPGVALPSDALVFRGGLPWVAVVEEGRVHFTPITLTATGDGVVLTEGLAEGLHVVTSGAAFLADGQNVVVAR